MKFDWNEIVFKDKSELKAKNYIFIVGFREVSSKRLLEFVRTYLPKYNVLIGVLKEDYLEGFEGQPQFKTMSKSKLNKFVEKLNSSKLQNSLDLIEYFQRDTAVIISKLKPSQVILVNGSWSKTFHLRPEFFELVKNNIKYKFVSPFSTEEEAKEYAINMESTINNLIELDFKKEFTDKELMQLVKSVSKKSFDWTYQIGALLVNNNKVVLSTYNKTLPYSTYAMHFGSNREKEFSPPGDLNNYDTIHAEANLIVEAGKKNIDLSNTSIYINLLPCPTCAKLIAESNIKEIVYSEDHSEGYAVKLLESMGKLVRRVVL